MKEELTAAIIIIGNEVLSGRVQDKNVEFIAKNLSQKGIALKEVRIIPDIEEYIIEAVNLLKSKYSYIFTTGGIGPTHDDITSKSIAKAFGSEYVRNEEAYIQIKEYYEKKGQKLNEAREKMAYMPAPARLINNDLTKAPGFVIENIFVLAGIPEIMQNMFAYVLGQLKSATKIESKNIKIYIGESLVAKDLENVQNKYPNIDIGSYPFLFGQEKPGTDIVFRSNNKEDIDNAYIELKNIFISKNYEIHE